MKVITLDRTSTPVIPASVAFDAELIAGELPKRAAALVAERAQLHPVELAENWERARRDELLLEIDPLPRMGGCRSLSTSQPSKSSGATACG
jgi:hypothetical protein